MRLGAFEFTSFSPPANPPPPSPASVFSAGEIGESPSTTPPFPPSIVGTYSCHGIEPAYDSVDRSDVVIAKINQDRGCVAYPFGMDRRQALFAAYDGHGEQGEVVSAFAMHEVQHRLEAHPDFILDVGKAFKEVFVEVDEALKVSTLRGGGGRGGRERRRRLFWGAIAFFF